MIVFSVTLFGSWFTGFAWMSSISWIAAWISSHRLGSSATSIVGSSTGSTTTGASSFTTFTSSSKGMRFLQRALLRPSGASSFSRRSRSCSLCCSRSLCIWAKRSSKLCSSEDRRAIFSSTFLEMSSLAFLFSSLIS